MRIVSAQLSALETLPPQHFAEFRRYLGSSSGSQSVQFRAIEAASGLRDAHFMHVLDGARRDSATRRSGRSRGPRCRSSSSRCCARAASSWRSLYVGCASHDAVLPRRSVARVRAAVRALALPPRAARRARARPTHRRDGRNARREVSLAHDRSEVLPRAVGGARQVLRRDGIARALRRLRRRAGRHAGVARRRAVRMRMDRSHRRGRDREPVEHLGEPARRHARGRAAPRARRLAGQRRAAAGRVRGRRTRAGRERVRGGSTPPRRGRSKAGRRRAAAAADRAHDRGRRASRQRGRCSRWRPRSRSPRAGSD